MRFIDADAAKKDADERGMEFFLDLTDVEEMKRFLDDQPTADVEELIHSEWLPSPDGISPIRCKRCNTPAPYVFVSTAQGDTELIRYKFNFCPYCGAKMDGGKE